jgi:hypothetical protein
MGYWALTDAHVVYNGSSYTRSDYGLQAIADGISAFNKVSVGIGLS